VPTATRQPKTKPLEQAILLPALPVPSHSRAGPAARALAVDLIGILVYRLQQPFCFLPAHLPRLLLLLLLLFPLFILLLLLLLILLLLILFLLLLLLLLIFLPLILLVFLRLLLLLLLLLLHLL
jgi:hypothetical protein